VDEIIEYAEMLMQYIQENAGSLSVETQQALGSFLQEIFQYIEEEEQGAGQQPLEEPPVHADSQLLWILSGQQPQAFISYLRTFPTPATQNLLNNPAQLNATIEQLNRMMPQGQQPFINGIQHADLNSSNIWGAAYDPRSGKMKVRFQGGSEYEYDGVPENIFRAFIKGNASARTKGRNEHGQWWVGKNPSLGAAMNQYIKAGGFNYRRIR
jgi:hypothetical protein